AGPSIAIVLGVIVALVAVPRVASPPALSAATVVAAPQHAPWLLPWAVLFAVAYQNVPRVLPRLGVLARELASPPAPPARRSTAGGAPPLSLARIPLAASPAATTLPAHSPPAQLSRALLGLDALPAAARHAPVRAASPLAQRLERLPPPTPASPSPAQRPLGSAASAGRSVRSSTRSRAS